MRKRTSLSSILAAAALLAGCGTTDARNQVVYPQSAPAARATEAKTNYSGCPGDAEELAPGSICPASAQCFQISGGRRCIVYEK